MLVQITREDDYKGPRSITAPSKEIREEYEAKCQSCGLCCCHPLTRVDGRGVSEPSLSYFATQEITYRWWHGYEETQTEEGYWMRMKDGHCIALEGELGKQVSCSIYPDRPSTCRAFEAGSEACLHLREKLKRSMSHLHRKELNKPFECWCDFPETAETKWPDET